MVTEAVQLTRLSCLAVIELDLATNSIGHISSVNLELSLAHVTVLHYVCSSF